MAAVHFVDITLVLCKFTIDRECVGNIAVIAVVLSTHVYKD